MSNFIGGVLALLIISFITVVVVVMVGRLKWTALVDDYDLMKMGLLVLLRRHNDYPRIFHWVPRWFTAFLGPQPRKIAGSCPITEHYDIPPLGTWVLSWPLYFAFRTSKGLHWRLGFRPDYEAVKTTPNLVDYYNLDTIFPRRIV